MTRSILQSIPEILLVLNTLTRNKTNIINRTLTYTLTITLNHTLT